MLFRGIESDLLPYCLEHESSVMAYAALARGLLSGKYKASHVFANDDDRARIPELTPAVQQAPPQLGGRALRWPKDRAASGAGS